MYIEITYALWYNYFKKSKQGVKAIVEKTKENDENAD